MIDAEFTQALARETQRTRDILKATDNETLAECATRRMIQLRAARELVRTLGYDLTQKIASLEQHLAALRD